MTREEILLEGWENPIFRIAKEMAELLGCSEEEAIEIEENRGFGITYFIGFGCSLSYPDVFGTSENSLRIYDNKGDKIFAGEVFTLDEFKQLCKELKIN